MTALSNALATRSRFLTAAMALDRALRQAEFDTTATGTAPLFFVPGTLVLLRCPPVP